MYAKKTANIKFVSSAVTGGRKSQVEEEGKWQAREVRAYRGSVSGAPSGV